MLPNTVFHDIFTTRLPDRRLAAADGLPSVTIIRNGVDTTVVATVVAGVVAGEYKYSFTVPSNWVAGDEVHARMAAVVNTVSIGGTRRLGVVADQAEVDKLDELHKLAGLSSGNPLFVPAGTGTITADDISIDVSGDCNVGHTLTRQP